MIYSYYTNVCTSISSSPSHPSIDNDNGANDVSNLMHFILLFFCRSQQLTPPLAMNFVRAPLSVTNGGVIGPFLPLEALELGVGMVCTHLRDREIGRYLQDVSLRCPWAVPPRD